MATTIEPIAFINGKRFILPPGRGEITLLTFLRGESSVLRCANASVEVGQQQPYLRRNRSNWHQIGLRGGRVSNICLITPMIQMADAMVPMFHSCGACTVMLSHWDSEEGKVVHRSANACLCPLYAVEGMHVVTVEGK